MKIYSRASHIQYLQQKINILSSLYGEYIKQPGKFPELKTIRTQLREMNNTLSQLLVVIK